MLSSHQLLFPDNTLFTCIPCVKTNLKCQLFKHFFSHLVLLDLISHNNQVKQKIYIKLWCNLRRFIFSSFFFHWFCSAFLTAFIKLLCFQSLLFVPSRSVDKKKVLSWSFGCVGHDTNKSGKEVGKACWYFFIDVTRFCVTNWPNWQIEI